MRKPDMVIGVDYHVVLHGVPIQATLLAFGFWGTDNLVKITQVPAKHPKLTGMHKVGATTNVTSVAIKYPATITIFEEA